MPLFLMGCFPVDFQKVKRPLRTKLVKRPIKVGKRPIKEGKRPIKAMVLVGISVGSLMGCFRAPPPWRKTAPLKRPIKRSMILASFEQVIQDKNALISHRLALFRSLCNKRQVIAQKQVSQTYRNVSRTCFCRILSPKLGLLSPKWLQFEFLTDQNTLWHEIITKIIPWEFLFVILRRFRTLKIFRKEGLFQGKTHEIRKLLKNSYFTIIFRKK